jgi:acylphosphatase
VEFKKNNNNRVSRYHLHLKGNFAQTGFGFMCMKNAFKLKVNGHLKYISAIEIEMNLAGDKNQIFKFYNWCLQSTETSDGIISPLPNNSSNYNEFKIINSL